MNDHCAPSQFELLDAIRAELSFLVEMYGFREVTQRTEEYVNPYSVLYRNSQVSVLIEGISYGCGMNCHLIIEQQVSTAAPLCINLGYLLKLRRPQLLEPAYPEIGGQLVQLKVVAAGLRAAAMDIITGDLSGLNEIRRFIEKEQEKTNDEARRRQIADIGIRSEEAFRDGKYQKVIDLLLPIEAQLSNANRKRLELAQKRLKA